MSRLLDPDDKHAAVEEGIPMTEAERERRADAERVKGEVEALYRAQRQVKLAREVARNILALPVDEHAKAAAFDIITALYEGEAKLCPDCFRPGGDSRDRRSCSNPIHSGTVPR